jgi:hypothetical protein
VAKPNYQFEKRQRDLAKKSKREEKLRQKLANKSGEPNAADGSNDAGDTPKPVANEDDKPD